MVSFSCDECQNVFTKPKIEHHLQQCRSATVSCIDCLKVFDASTVRAHKSCITEAAKYGPKAAFAKECSQAYCGICSLHLNNAVHALQHYESRKHRAAERRMKEVAKADEKKKLENASSEMTKEEVAEDEAKESKEITHDARGDCEKKKLGIKKAMKKILKKAPKSRLKRDGLISALAVLLGQSAPDNLGDLVDKKARASATFKVKKGRISLASIEKSRERA